MITILLSTYNGARFLSEQLASFERQTYSDWRVVWRDDGSTDNTVEIMEAFNSRTNKCMRIVEPTTHLGSTSSYFLLLKKVSDLLAPRDLVMFSDQDDVWLPQKIEKVQRSLEFHPIERPALYFARLQLVDWNLDNIGKLPALHCSPFFRKCISQNIAAGCTIGLNSIAAKMIKDGKKPKHSYHDWWALIFVLAKNGTVIYDNSIVALYRQHSANTVGARQSYLHRATNAIRRGPVSFKIVFSENITALHQNKSEIDPKTRRIVNALHKNIDRKFFLFFILIKNGISRQNFIETLVFYIFIIIG